MTLVDDVVDAVRDRTPFEEPTVRGNTVGEDLLLVEVGDGSSRGERAAGVAHRPPGVEPPAPDGRDALQVADWAGDPPGGDERSRRGARAVGLATLNALSAPLVDWRTGDPFEAIDPAVGTIATVGLFRPAFRKFGEVTVRVIERDPVSPPETPPGVRVETYTPDEREAALDGVEVLFVTGSSLVYGGTDAYLAAADRIPTVVLVGATASFLPDPAFAAGVTTLAGARVADVASVRAGIEAGACGTDLHDEGLEKVYVTSGGRTPGLDLG